MENTIGGLSLMTSGLVLFVLTQLKPKRFWNMIDRHYLRQLLNNQNMAIALYLVSVTFMIGDLLVFININ